MGQIESQIFSSSYVAKVILGTISPVQPKSDDAAGVCQAPAPIGGNKVWAEFWFTSRQEG